MQGVISDLQSELARLLAVQPVNPTISDDESMALVPRPAAISIRLDVRVDRRSPREALSGCSWQVLQMRDCKPGLREQSCW